MPADRRTRSSAVAVVERPRRLVPLVLALAVLLATAAPAAAQDAPAALPNDGVVATTEQGCFETGDRRPVPPAVAESYLPAGYELSLLGGMANVGFVDYVCGALSVDGHEARPTIVSMGTVSVTRAGDYLLWIGTDNPLHFARLQQLGVNVFFIPRSTVQVSTTSEGFLRLEVEYVGTGPGGLDYTRTITTRTATPPTGTTTESAGLFWHEGSAGEVRVDFDNLTEPGWPSTVCFELAEGSLPLAYGITEFPTDPSCFPNARTLIRGSWDGTWTLTGAG